MSLTTTTTVQQWEELLPNPDIMVTGTTALENAAANTTEYKERKIPLILQPQSLQDVHDIVSTANQLCQSLYVVSTGKNWGVGSKLPVEKEAVLVTMEHMNRIREVNERFRYAIIEPGVTQKQLSEYLKEHHPKLMFPPTGSSGYTSIVGNIHDRGVGVLGHRYNFLRGIEAVTGENKLIRTGFWHYRGEDSDMPIYYAPGVGPDLQGLFTQSNLGIVTAMVVKLEPVRQRSVLAIEFDEPHLASVTEALYFLREDGIVKDGTLITGMNDPRASGGKRTARGKWFACSQLFGTEDMMKLAKNEVSQKLGHLTNKLRFYDLNEPSDEEITPYIDILQRMLRGETTEYAMNTMAQLGGYQLDEAENIDHSKNIIGFNCALPAVPFSGPHVTQIIQEVDRISEEIGITPFYNFFGMTENSLEGFFRVFFDRKNEHKIAKAHRWNQAVHDRLFEIGFYPYRMNVEQMKDLYTPANTYWEVVKNIKQTLDPNHIISPGNYCPNHD